MNLSKWHASSFVKPFLIHNNKLKLVLLVVYNILQVILSSEGACAISIYYLFQFNLKQWGAEPKFDWSSWGTKPCFIYLSHRILIKWFPCGWNTCITTCSNRICLSWEDLIFIVKFIDAFICNWVLWIGQLFLLLIGP